MDLLVPNCKESNQKRGFGEMRLKPMSPGEKVHRLRSARNGEADVEFAGFCVGPATITADTLDSLRKDAKFCHSESRCAPRNLPFPRSKSKRDSSLRSE